MDKIAEIQRRISVQRETLKASVSYTCQHCIFDIIFVKPHQPPGGTRKMVNCCVDCIWLLSYVPEGSQWVTKVFFWKDEYFCHSIYASVRLEHSYCEFCTLFWQFDLFKLRVFHKLLCIFKSFLVGRDTSLSLFLYHSVCHPFLKARHSFQHLMIPELQPVVTHTYNQVKFLLRFRGEHWGQTYFILIDYLCCCETFLYQVVKIRYSLSLQHNV